MIKSFKYRIYPNIKQKETLFSIFNFCRFLYNSALEERISYYKSTKKSISYVTQSAYLPDIKQNFKQETNNIYSQTLQYTLKQLDNSYQNFFRKVKQNSNKLGFPRFKSKDRFKSICFPQVKSDLFSGCVKLINNKLRIYGINSDIKIKYHRPIQGIAKQCRIIYSNNNWYIVISCDNVPKNVLPKTNKEVAIDLGIESFITLDDGTKFHHPKPYKTSLEKLQYRQRKLALKKLGSNNRRKQKKLVVKTHEHIVNIREDYQHKLANKLIKDYDKIIIEDLNIKCMLEAKGFEVNKSNIQDASWGKFIEKLIYKAESADKLIVKVDPRNTSKMCSRCGNINKSLALRDRIYRCEVCGFTLDRDHNAAINIRRLGTSLAIINNFKNSQLKL